MYGFNTMNSIFCVSHGTTLKIWFEILFGSSKKVSVLRGRDTIISYYSDMATKGAVKLIEL